MKATLKLENIDKTGSGVEFANIICELSENQHLDKEIVTVKLSCTHNLKSTQAEREYDAVIDRYIRLQ